MKPWLLPALIVATLWAAPAAVSAAPPRPVWEFTFDDAASGVRANNTGSDPNAASAYLTMRDAGGTAGNFRVAGGPSGRPGDLAFSSVTSGLVHYASVAGANTGGISGFAQVTLSGWYKATQPVAITPQYVRIFLIGNRDLWDEGMVADFNPQNLGYNQIGLEINDYYNRAGDGGGDAYGGPVVNDTGVWRFWAMTYDGVPTASNVNIYMGTTSGAAALIATGSISHIPLPELKLPTNNPTGIIRNAGGDFVLSANIEHGYADGFVGYQDNIRVYNSVLSSADIEAVRQADLAPEPCTLGLLLLGGLALIRRRNT